MSPRPRLVAITDVLASGLSGLGEGVLAGGSPGLRVERLRDRVERWNAVLESLSMHALPETILVLLRDKGLPVRERWNWGRSLRELTRRHRQWFSVAHRADLALALEADAVHLGEQSVLPADVARRWPQLWVSRACHDPTAAAGNGADAVVLSPLLAERKGATPLGLGALRVARAASGGALLYALGGITADRVQDCLTSGADGVAVIGALLHHPMELLEALQIRRGGGARVS